MTNEEADALGARLAACKHFRPMAGLRDMQGRTWEASLLWRWSPSVDRPDIREPATQGIVMALIREARGEPSWQPTPLEHDPGIIEWVVEPPSRVRQTLYPCEEDAMVVALENAS